MKRNIFAGAAAVLLFIGIIRAQPALQSTPEALQRYGNYLPITYQAPQPLQQAQLEATIAALVAQNAQQATRVADDSELISSLLTKVPAHDEYISSLFTRVPAQDRVRAVEALAYQQEHLATNVAALYLALGSPAPTPPPSPTFGPSPIPTRTP